jgi:hypothetical protein
MNTCDTSEYGNAFIVIVRCQTMINYHVLDAVSEEFFSLRSVGRSETLTLLIYAFVCFSIQRACELMNLQGHTFGWVPLSKRGYVQ